MEINVNNVKLSYIKEGEGKPLILMHGSGEDRHIFDEIINKLKKEDNWAMDYEDIEKKIIKHNIHFAIFCSPHNPTGRVWKKEEIQKFMDICKKHDVLVFSDEIWSDLVRKENTHIPTQSINFYNYSDLFFQIIYFPLMHSINFVFSK